MHIYLALLVLTTSSIFFQAILLDLQEYLPFSNSCSVLRLLTLNINVKNPIMRIDNLLIIFCPRNVEIELMLRPMHSQESQKKIL